MARPKTVIELLAEQPETELRRMRDVTRDELTRLQGEIARLHVEAAQIDQALAKRGRSGSGSRGVITADMVLDIARTSDMPFPAAAIRDVFKNRGLDASLNGVRNHLNRLVERGDLGRTEDGGYFVPATSIDEMLTEVPRSGGDGGDDIPF